VFSQLFGGFMGFVEGPFGLFLLLGVLALVSAILRSTPAAKAKRAESNAKTTMILQDKNSTLPTSYKVQGSVISALIYACYGFLFTQFSFVGLWVGVVAGFLLGFVSVAVADMARKKGRSFTAFFFLSVFVSPLIMWIVAASIADASNVAPVVAKESQDLTEQISKLGELLSRGLISEDEFQTKKSELLNRI
jgi:uncharacterized membrane protein